MKCYEVNVFSRYMQTADAHYSDCIFALESNSIADICDMFCSRLRSAIREQHNAYKITTDACITELTLASAIEKLFNAGLYEVKKYDDHTEIYITL